MEPQHAGFWRRLGAAMIDALLLAIPITALCMGVYLLVPDSTPHAPVWTPIQILETIHIIYPAYMFDMLLVLDPIRSAIAAVILPFVFGVPSNGLIYVLFVQTLLNWLYHALLESSSKQASLGKLLFKIRVIDLNGNRISFWRATARHFSKIISTLTLLVGYMMAGWTMKKQALHDKIAGCLVVRR